MLIQYGIPSLSNANLMGSVCLPRFFAALSAIALLSCHPARAAEPSAQTGKGDAAAANNTTTITARLAVEPTVWPASSLQDVTIRMILKNEGAKTTILYPLAARPIGLTSIASEGIEWILEATSAEGGTRIPIQEIRTYYGPPGEPRTAEWLRSHGRVSLSPGREHETKIEACWIPNSLLQPEQLDPVVLDPEGMDNIGPAKSPRPPGQTIPPPLSQSFSLARASVLVVRGTCKAIRKSIGKERALLRGQVVAFFPKPGQYLLGARYIQNSWKQIGEKLGVIAAPVRVWASDPRQ